MAVYIGIDLGTSSVKVGAFTGEGEQIALSSRDYPMHVDVPGMNELDPDQVVFAALDALEECVHTLRSAGEEPRAIGFSTQLHSLMAVEDGRPLTRLLTWADQRGESQREQILASMDVMGIFQRTAGRIEHPVFWPAKLCWLYQTRPELFRPGVLFMGIKCYLLYHMVGRFVADWSDASATGIFNIHDFTWDDLAVDSLPGLTRENLVPVLDCAEALPGMKRELADRIGVRSDIPIVMGAGDGMTAHLGCGAIEPGILSSTVGTSGAIRAMSPEPVLDPYRRTFCFCLQRDFYVAGGAVNNGGIVLGYLQKLFPEQWAADQARLGASDFYQMIDRMAGEIPPGSEGLVFLPFLAGERAPNYNGKATATYAGLTLHHDRRHMLRAALEGVMYQLNGVYRALEAVTGPAKAIHANGGYTYSDFWMQLQADIFGAPVHVSGVGQASAFGAAYLAMFGVGDIPSIRTPLPVMRPERAIEPNEKNHAIYLGEAEKYYARYDKIYR